MPEQEGNLNIPQVAIVVLLGYIIYRVFFKPAASSSNVPPQRPPAVDPQRLAEQVEVLHNVFPQTSRAALEAELVRNGGSIEITTERILAQNGLPEPPGIRPAPRPQPSPRPAANQSTRPQAASPAGPSSATQPSLVQYPDLLTRYNLHHRLKEEKDADEEGATKGKKGKAPATKDGRMLAHKEKRDQMILAARRQVEKMPKP